MIDTHEDLRARLTAIGQEHVLRFWDELDGAQRESLAAELSALDLETLPALIASVLEATPHESGALEPCELIELGDDRATQARDARAREAGAALLSEGKVAAFLVAGGQGTRLGYDGPKGRFPVGPLTHRSLFAYHAHRVRATCRRYDATLPYYVMTSTLNHDSSVAAFNEAENFGLEPDQVSLFQQGMLPAVDLEGKILLADKHKLALSPDGHGGSFAALMRSGALDDMERRGIEQVFYFQVDNPLAPVFDPVFLGHHVLAGAEMSTKVVPKSDPHEKVGVLGKIDGKLGVIEYSDLSDELAKRTDDQGRLVFRAGNIAIHAMSVPFIRRIASGDLSLPVHRALKKVPHVDANGVQVSPSEPNAIKMETFVFDALPLAQTSITQEVRREDEFAPVKNAEGSDSPAVTSQMLSDQGKRWMKAAGLSQPPGPVEVGPLFALDQEEFLATLTRSDFGPVFDRS